MRQPYVRASSRHAVTTKSKHVSGGMTPSPGSTRHAGPPRTYITPNSCCITEAEQMERQDEQVCPLSCGKRSALLSLLGTRPHCTLSLQTLQAQCTCGSKNSPSCKITAAQWELPKVRHLFQWGTPYLPPKLPLPMD